MPGCKHQKLLLKVGCSGKCNARVHCLAKVYMPKPHACSMSGVVRTMYCTIEYMEIQVAGYNQTDIHWHQALKNRWGSFLQVARD